MKTGHDGHGVFVGSVKAPRCGQKGCKRFVMMMADGSWGEWCPKHEANLAEIEGEWTARLSRDDWREIASQNTLANSSGQKDR